MLPEQEAGFVQKAVSLLPLVGEIAAFGSVTLIAHTGIHSKTFKLWRASQKQPLGSDDLITAGQIGNLQAKPKWLEFNLADLHCCMKRFFPERTFVALGPQRATADAERDR